ncbi:MAG TPA: SDR family oxidoreductase [Candidatus Marinimicrobia bacterium]|nr:SDR family oxidoreductase [Candidatus Neomarinimicrobiota bacterium]
MDLKLTGKTALVTGSTAGIGFGIARQLLQEGTSVVINGRTEARINSALDQLRRAIPDCTVQGCAADFADADAVQHLLDEHDSIDILINNVGIFSPKPFAEITDEEWLHFFEVNVLSGVRLSRHYLPRMLDQNWGRIIFISSESGIQIPAEMVHYGTTKTAQLGVSRGLAQQTAGTNVTVNTVIPGSTRSEGSEKFISDLAQERGLSKEDVEREFFEKIRPTSLLERFATIDEVATFVTYLASPLAAANNGAALRVDGGTVSTIL